MGTTSDKPGRGETRHPRLSDHSGWVSRSAKLAAAALLAACASSNQWAPPKTEQPTSEMTLKFLNVRHEPKAAWGKGGFRPRLEICAGGKPGCGVTWCYDCPDNGATRQWDISDTSVGAILALPAQELTITAYTNEKEGECKADPLTIAPKKKLQYQLVYSHVWSGADHRSYRCAATVERVEEGAPEPAPETEGEGEGAGGAAGAEAAEPPAAPEAP